MTVEDFRYQYNMIKGRCKKTRNTTDNHRKIHELDFDIEYLKEVWDNQNGICPISNIRLILKTNKTKKEQLSICHASIDRIKPELGYIKGNIRFISVMANYAINDKFSDDDLYMFCKTVVHKRIQEIFCGN